MRKKVFWRRTRRVLYVLAGVGLLAPVVAFVVTYQSVSVPDPSLVAASHDQEVTLYYADGSVMYKKSASGSQEMATWEQIPDIMKKAQMAAEDATFMTNNGFDVNAIVRTVWNRLSGGTGGGSTIGQQYVKNAVDDREDTLKRKFVEMVTSYKMTRTYSKADILTAYLNTVYFGRGAYGIKAAAQAFFGEDVSKLTTEQAALLAGMVQAPASANNSAYQHRRYDYVMGRLLANNWITRAEYDSAQFPAPVADSDTSAPGGLSKVRKYIVDAVFEELAQDGQKEEDLYSSGAKIYTTINPAAQEDAEQAVTKIMAANAQYPDEASALVSVDPRSGGVLAYYGGDGSTSYDLAQTPQQPGSSFKPYVLAAALRKSPDTIGLNTMYDGSDNQTIAGQVVHNSEGESAGRISVKDAMTESINTVFYQMGAQVGVNSVRQAAWDAGIPKQITSSIGSTFDSLQNVDPKTGQGSGVTELGISIGQYQVRPIDQAQGYATLANDGMYVPVHFVGRVTDSSGGRIYQFNSAPAQAFSSDASENAAIAHTVSAAMTDVAEHSDLSLGGNRPSAVKTGTAQFGDTGHNSEAWTVGYTPQAVTAVWFGNKKQPAPIFGNYHNGKGKERGYDVYGREEPGYIWQEFMNAYLTGKPVKQLSLTGLIRGTSNDGDDSDGDDGDNRNGDSTFPDFTTTESQQPPRGRDRNPGTGVPTFGTTFPTCFDLSCLTTSSPGRRHRG
ncbi:MAG TPA: transglycosylase domain-containing protein [Amycolatopsis sp.]|uniref:transglycosylase domain-containing protein n=1 Tax=Amycolatopsis sp. TaxID=37632 RepID=UPI002B45FA19|nr:transglycosylase domain-containing protein [Amycolatopsis sp.]HKS46523.1 transglycosylase domain-containing protein [Amycolatopsis sp.]